MAHSVLCFMSHLTWGGAPRIGFQRGVPRYSMSCNCACLGMLQAEDLLQAEVVLAGLALMPL